MCVGATYRQYIEYPLLINALPRYCLGLYVWVCDALIIIMAERGQNCALTLQLKI